MEGFGSGSGSGSGIHEAPNPQDLKQFGDNSTGSLFIALSVLSFVFSFLVYVVSGSEFC